MHKLIEYSAYNRSSDDIASMLKYLYIVDKDLMNSFVGESLESANWKVLVSVYKALRIWIGDTSASLNALRTLILKKIKELQTTLVIPSVNGLSCPTDSCTCSCAECLSFKRFLAHPKEATWQIKV